MSPVQSRALPLSLTRSLVAKNIQMVPEKLAQEEREAAVYLATLDLRY